MDLEGPKENIRHTPLPISHTLSITLSSPLYILPSCAFPPWSLCLVFLSYFSFSISTCGKST